jgi:hypothetical protein
MALARRGPSQRRRPPLTFIIVAATKCGFPRWGGQVAAAMMPAERRARRSSNVLKLAALALAAATATQSPALMSGQPWWEKVTVTLSGDGAAHSCKYETSLRVAASNTCQVSGGAKGFSASSTGSGSKEEITRITFERRFFPGVAAPADTTLEPGDTLLGKQVMALAIDGAGAVKACKIVAKGGDMTPEYGCDEAQTERFEATAKTAAADHRVGFMTVLVYGHEEHVA